MGTNYYVVRNKPTTQEAIHIGNLGWKFLFYQVNEPWNDPPVVWNTFSQFKEWLQKYVVETKDFVIMDEYDREIPFNDFIDLVEQKQKENNEDDFTYNRNVDGYRFEDT